MLNKVSLVRRLSLVAIMAFSVLSVHATTFTFTPNDGEGDLDDMFDLDHYKYFTWGFKDFKIPVGEHITSATLSIFNINNWAADENGFIKKGTYYAENWLNIWLLDSVPNTSTSKQVWVPAVTKKVGKKTVTVTPGHYETVTTVVPHESSTGLLTAYDDAAGGSDYFATNWNQSAKVKVTTYTDKKGGPDGDVVNLNYSFQDFHVLDELEAYINNSNDFGIGIDPDCHYWNTGVKLVICTEPNVVSVSDTGNPLGLLGLGMGLMVYTRRKLRR